MSDEPTFEAEVTAPELEATAAIQPAENLTPETPAEEPAPKTFTQEELDAAIGKRIAREHRKWEREQSQRPAERPQQAIHADDFDSTEAYAEAWALQKAEVLVAQREAARQQATVLDAYQDREEQAREKYDDFEQVAYNPTLKVTDVMAQAIQASDIGPDVIYHLGSNPKEADRISKLPPILQAKEIGKLEASLAASPPVKRTSTAPSPITPVTARTTGSPAYDTTDPRAAKAMTTSEWIEADRQRLWRQAQNR